MTQLERAIQATTVIPVSDALVRTVAEFRFDCRVSEHPLHNPVHNSDLWIAATAVHVDAVLLTADGVFDDAPGLRLASS